MENTKFIIKSYGTAEFARLYRPFVQDQSAIRTLKNWIEHNPDLQHELNKAGYYKGTKMLTPLQVSIMIKYFGEP